MKKFLKEAPGSTVLMLGNEAIARGALEAGIAVCSGYPGTPSSEITDTLSAVADETGIYVEWSINEKVAAEVAAAASFAGLRSMVTMKSAGINVASDFLQHHNLSGIGPNGAGMVVIVCDDPGALSSADEQDTRWIPRSADVPLLVPTDLNSGKELLKYAFDLSEKYKTFVVFRSYTRFSHASGDVTVGELPEKIKSKSSGEKARFDTSTAVTPETPEIVSLHKSAHERNDRIQAGFESSELNFYEGPKNPKTLVVCCGGGCGCAREAIDELGIGETVGVLNIATLWPIPVALIAKHLTGVQSVLILEEPDPFLEVYVKEIVADDMALAGRIRVYGKGSGHIAHHGELTPAAGISAIARILDIEILEKDASYSGKAKDLCKKMVIPRGAIWCSGCPHRASFWAISRAIKKLRKKGDEAFVAGDIGCNTMDIYPTGYQVTKLIHAMGSGFGEASGFGILKRFGFDQTVIAVCGDSGFFHSSFPALINAIHAQAQMLAVVLDNNATAMTGFQANPGMPINAMGKAAPQVDIGEVCRAIGCKVAVVDPFDVKATTKKVLELAGENGVKVLVMKRTCELARMRSERKHPYIVSVDPAKCKGEECGFCTKHFACPGLTCENEGGITRIVPETCAHCGVCVDICPHGAISKEEV